MKRQEVEPFFFGPAEKRLFGCYHEPQSELVRTCGVVLCYPMGDEYLRAHRAHRQLAIRLARAGFHVLRFDFYGCGDSAGDGDEGSMSQWLQDVSTAIEELRRRCGLFDVCLVGHRLGATLSAMAAAERGDIEFVILWDPVVNGKAYLEELDAAHRALLQSFPTVPELWTSNPAPAELLGFPMTGRLRRELQDIDLLEIGERPAEKILLIESGEEIREQGLRAHLESKHACVEHQHLRMQRSWMDDMSQILVPHRILQGVAFWLSENCP